MKIYFFLFIGLILLSCQKNDCMDCDNRGQLCIEGNSNIIEQVLEIDDIVGIVKSGAFKANITHGAKQVIIVTGDSNIINFLNKTVDEKIWNIKLSNEHCYSNFDLFVEIQIPSLEFLNISGAGDIQLGNIVSNNKQLEITKSGSSDIIVSNESTLDDLSIDKSGSGLLKAFKLEVKQGAVSSKGSGNSELTVINELTINLSGSGNIYYKGNPQINSTQVGSGKIIDAN